MRLQISLITVTALLAACAGTPDPYGDTTVAGGSNLVCTKEYPTGSHMPKRVCRTRAQIEADEAAVRMLENRMADKKPYRERQAGGNP